jgi:hypothetical protein
MFEERTRKDVGEDGNEEEKGTVGWGTWSLG